MQSDHLGSTSTLTDASGSVVARERYSAFGERRRSDNLALTDRLYTGQQYNSLSGLYHYSDGKSAGRFYDPLLARFVQPDPLLPHLASQGLNRYAPNYNNPLRYKDPDGHDPWDVINGASEFAGGFIAQAGYNFAPYLPTASNLQAQPGESGWATAGRVAADVASVGAGASVAGGGAGLMGSGVLACATGIGCAEGAPAIAIGAVGVAAGSTTAITAGSQAGEHLNILMATRKGWSTGDPINKPNTDGSYPNWTTVRERYWKNRAASASEGEFSAPNMGLMKRGNAPKARILARLRETQAEVEFLVEKELHHIEGRSGPDPHNVNNLTELWPWEHEAIDPSRHLGYDFLQFK